MSPVTNETKIALLEQRMETVEKFVETAPSTYVTKSEVGTMIASAMVSREDFKADMVEVLISHGASEKRDTRNWVLELVKVLVTMIGTGGIATIIVALASAPK
jgi:hypothetical protein